NVRNALAGKYLWELANALNLLLTDRGDAKDPKKPNLVEFWEQPELKNLRAEVTKFKETVQYGDPLVIGNKFGRGRVVAFLTTAGRSWNDWPGGSPASVTYPVVMLELHKYLTSVGADNDLTVGTPLDVTLDATRYEPKMHGFYEPEIVDAPAAGAKPAAKLTDLGEQAGSISQGRLSFSFTGAREPGVYLFDFFPRAEGQVEAKPEQRAFVFNVDTVNEGPLQRASKDDLERSPAGGKAVTLHGVGSPPVVDQRQTDLSESPWFYLLFLVILVLEQAMAVHLSFHLKGSEAVAPPAARTATVAAA
ncbi:MAG TPA: hypothetical protein VKH44_04050, partial [Pirellulaceae bacterium]|nr:hypothetical protein [Pirellulaceae bacterium]